MKIKDLTRSDQQPDRDDVEAHYLRRDERESDRQAQLERRRWSDRQLYEYDDDQILDLESTLVEAPAPKQRRARGTASPAGPTVKSTGQHNPFRKLDKAGRRLQSERVTFALTRKQVAGLHEKVLRANAMGLPMTTFVTITWVLVGVIGDDAVAKAQNKVFKRVRDWARRREFIRDDRERPVRLDTQIAWIWVKEAGPERGLHSHILFSCPPEHRTALRTVVARAVAAAAGRPAGEKQVSLPGAPTPVLMQDSAPTPTGRPEMRAQWTFFGYLTKSPTVSYQPDGRYLSEGTGRVVGQRCGYSSHLLGGSSWAEYAEGQGKTTAWTAEFLRTTKVPFPLDISPEHGPFKRGADQAAIDRHRRPDYPKRSWIVDLRGLGGRRFRI